MWSTLLAELTTMLAPSEISRLAQLLKAAGLTAGQVVAAHTAPIPGLDVPAQQDIEDRE